MNEGLIHNVSEDYLVPIALMLSTKIHSEKVSIYARSSRCGKFSAMKTVPLRPL